MKQETTKTPESLREQLEAPCRGTYDLIVCGAGVAGVSAAVSAARNGVKRILLIEKGLLLGGLATSGLIAYYEPICDGCGNKLMYGMPSELLQLARKYGPSRFAPQWNEDPDFAACEKRYSGFFSPTVFSMALDEWVQADGVEILLDTVVVRPITEGTHCRGVVVENKTGRGYYQADMIIDTTGDLDILHRAGAESELGQNYLTYAAYLTYPEKLQEALKSGNMLDARRWLTHDSNQFGKGHPEGYPLLSGTTAEEVTKFVLDGRRRFFEDMKQEDPSKLDVSILPTMAQLRTTRRLIGAYTLTEQDQQRSFDDSIGVAGDFRHRGVVYEIPFRTLYCDSFDNLLTAGRTISSSGWAWQVTRVIPVAVLTGQAAGAAAASLLQSGHSVRAADIGDIQYRMRQGGVRLHMEETKTGR